MTMADQGNHNASGQDTAAAIRAALRGRRDLELSLADAAQLAETYRASLGDYRGHSLQCLEAGDYQQAAEKSWGAFAESVKAIAADYGLRLSHHCHVIRVSGQLATLAAQHDTDAEPILRDGLSAARSLHQHFYENDLPADDVIFSTNRVAAAIDLMQQRFSSANDGSSRGG